MKKKTETHTHTHAHTHTHKEAAGPTKGRKANQKCIGEVPAILPSVLNQNCAQQK